MDYESLYERAKNDDRYMHWFQQKGACERENESAQKIITKLIRRIKNNILMQLYITNPELIPPYFTSEKISEVLKAKIIKSSEASTKSHMFIQAMAILITRCITNPEQFAEKLDLFFKLPENQKNYYVEFFALYTLPSFYGNLVVPDVLHNARRLAISLLAINPESDLTNYFCASFFLCSPKFIDFLWEDYFHFFITTTIGCHYYKYFNILLKSIEKASSFLTTHHIMLINQLYELGPLKFAYVIVRLVLEPTLKIRLQKDSTSHLYFPGNIICFESLWKIFDFIFTYPLNTSCAKALYRAMTRKNNTEQFQMNLGEIGFQCFPCIVSLKEFKNLLNIMRISENINDALNTIGNIKLEHQESLINFVLLMYNLMNETKTLFFENALLFPKQEKIEIDFDESSDHKFSFEKLKSNAAKMGLNPIALLEPSFLEFSSPLRVVASRYNNSLEILRDEEFKKFSMIGFINEYIPCYSLFEMKINICILIQEYKEMLDASSRAFFLMIEEFLNDNSKLMRKRLSLMKMQFEETVPGDGDDENCTFFKEFAFGFNITRYLPFRNEEFYVRKMQELKSMKGYTLKMEIKELFVFFPLIFRFMRDFVLSQGVAEESYEFKAHYFFLIISMFSHQILNKLYQAFSEFCFFSKNNLIKLENAELAKNEGLRELEDSNSRENLYFQNSFIVNRNHIVEDDENENFFNDAKMEEIIKEWKFFKIVFEENQFLKEQKEEKRESGLY